MDRTSEFLQLAEQFTNNSVVAAAPKTVSSRAADRSAFHEAAGEIARGIHKASGTLAKLTKLVRKQGLFDDSTDEINTLIFRIKQDLDELNTKCDSAQQYVDKYKTGSHQLSDYNSTVVTSLKTGLMTTTKEFKSVLEIRSSKMKDQQNRKAELTGSSFLSPMKTIKRQNTPGEANAAVMASPYAKLPPASSSSSSSSSSSASNPMNSHISGELQHQQLLFVPQANEQFYESRQEAATEVEKTIGELGVLFKRLATMIAEQQTLVERIDDDVETAVSNTEQAQNMLMEALRKAQSNWGLYMKLSAIFGVFALFFIVFLL